jgi:nucleotide-binding universal stress UspA family protein
MYDDILLPTDGSAAAEAAVDHAIRLARAFDATVHVLSVVEPIPAVEMDAAMIHERLRESAQTAVDRACERLDAAGVPHESSVRDGSAHRSILTAADEADVDLIVMGTHGRTGVGRVLLGSVTERVVRSADAPVMAVRYHPEEEEAEAAVAAEGDEEA